VLGPARASTAAAAPRIAVADRLAMRVVAVSLVAVSLVVACAAFAQETTTPRQAATIEVIGVTPIDGIGLDRAKYPTNAQRITRAPDASVTDALSAGLASAELNDPQGAPLQSDLQFRGFSVSPLLGAPEALAMFQDGVRTNEPFGDTLVWPALPSSAIESIEIIPGANPVFGLNALGGAIVLRTRSSADATAGTLRAGSFGRTEAEFATGGASWFLSGAHLRDGGWRDHSPSDATHLFGSMRCRSGDVRMTLGRAMLTGNGAVPEDLLEVDRRAVFTHPDETRNEALSLSTTQQRALGGASFAQATAYARHTRARTFNGDDTPYEPCEESDFLCFEDEVLLDTSGAPIPLDDDEEFDATNNRTRLQQTAFGLAMQLDRTAARGRMSNRILAGASIDAGYASFRSSTEVASLNEDRGTSGTGIVTAESLVRLNTRSMTLSAFAADILTPLPRLTVTTTARVNHVRMQLDDRIGESLDGNHSFTQFHPSAGAAYELGRGLSAFANAGLTGRTPTPVELSCADPEDPCRLPNAFVSDPPLRAVTSHTFEIGARGNHTMATWSAAVFRATNEDDLLFISSGPLRGEGHFANVGTTRRQGLELSVQAHARSRLHWSASYAWLDATFTTPFVVAAPNHPDAVDGEIEVEAGDRLPLVPRHILKVAATFDITPRASIGAFVRATGKQWLRGDEANLEAPIEAYTIADARAEFRVTSRTRLIAELRNALNANYATFGTFGDAEDVLGEDYEGSRRFVTPATPRNVTIAIRTRF
jgi:iron complex outermembrane receptor protein